MTTSTLHAAPVQALRVPERCRGCDPDPFRFRSTGELEDLTQVLEQEFASSHG